MDDQAIGTKAYRSGISGFLTVPVGLRDLGESERPRAETENGQVPAATGICGVAKAIRLLLADDRRVMRQGLAKLIAGQPNIELAGEASSGVEAVEQALRLVPDVILMDVSMPEMDGIEATRRIKEKLPEVPVIGLSMFADENIVLRMREAGAESFVGKTASPAELLEAIYGIGGRAGGGNNIEQ